MKFLASAAALLLAAGTAQAATYTLSFPASIGVDSTISVPGATLKALDGKLITDGSEFCATNGSTTSLICAGDSELLFTQAVKNLSFTVGGWDVNDMVALEAYNGTNLVATLAFLVDGEVDLGTLTITKLFFNDNSQGNGVYYKDITFDLAEVEPTPPTVPVPASLPLLAAGLAGLVALRRRKA